MRSWQDLHGFGHNPCAGGWAAQHHAGDVPIAYHAQVGARGLADHPARPRLPHRGHAQWRRSQPAARHLRGEAEQRQDGLRGQAPQPARDAAHGPQGVAEALSWSDVLYHGQGQRQAGLLLGARLSQGKVRSESGRRRQSGFRRCDSRLRDAEADRARLHRQAQGLGGTDHASRRHHTLFRAVAG